MAILPETSIQIRIASDPAHLPVVRAALEEICRLIGFDDGSRGQIVLAVDEALTNIIRHAYGDQRDQPIQVNLHALSDGDRQTGIEIVLYDRGRRVDLSQIQGRDLDDVRPGGLGVHIMRRCMDRVDYTYEEPLGTRLTMARYLPGAAAASTGESGVRDGEPRPE